MTDLRQDLIQRLTVDLGFRVKPAEGGERLTGGRCPACGEPEAYTPPGNPFILICPRLNKCGARTPTKSLYPEFFERFEAYHPPTKENPRATADAYLKSRGIDPVKISGWYQQERTADPEHRERAYPTLRFTLSNGVAYHRLIDYSGRNKNKIVAPYAGAYWAPPGFKPEGDLWLTEGVLDAVSLCLSGINAAATLSSGHVPTSLLEALKDQPVVLVIAQDPDRAGHKGARKLAEACRSAGMRYKYAFAPEGLDWNDLLLRGELAPDRLRDTVDDSLWEGRLFGVGSATDFYAVWREKRHDSLFAFQGEYWVGRADRDPPEIHRISDFTAERLYRLRLEQVRERPEYQEVLRVRHCSGEEHEVVLSGAALAKNGAFREALFTGASCQWDGSMWDLNALLRRLRGRPAPIVRQLDFYGYDRSTDAYYFHDSAYGPDGRRVGRDERGIVAVAGIHARLKPLGAGDEFIWLTPQPGLDIPVLFRDLRAVSKRGLALAALGFFVASLFADQLARDLGMFPFLSLYGDSHTGKTTLLMILNRLLGREWEGIPISEANTRIGTALFIGSWSNLPVVLTEADAHEGLQVESIFNLRSAYNRGPIRITGQKDGSTRISPFRGALVFGWNVEKLEDAKVRERLVSLHFSEQENSDDKLAALTRLDNIASPVMAGFLDAVLSRRQAILERLKARLDPYGRWFEGEGVRITRTSNNHAVPAAGLDAVLSEFVKDSDLREELLDCALRGLLDAAQRKERELRDDPDDIQLFFDRVSTWLRQRNGDGRMLLENHSREPKEVAVSLREFEDLCAEKHVHWRKDYAALRRSPHFVRGNAAFRKPDGSFVKCWVFRAEAAE